MLVWRQMAFFANNDGSGLIQNLHLGGPAFAWSFYLIRISDNHDIDRRVGRSTVRLRVPLWALPLVYAVASLILALAFPRFEYEHLAAYSRGISVSSAQAFLSAVASGMMSLTAIVFSIAFLVVQFSASAFSKRLVLLFGQDPIVFNSLGMFFATFIYALAELLFVDRSGDGKVPYFSTLLVGVLLALSVILLATAGPPHESASGHECASHRR